MNLNKPDTESKIAILGYGIEGRSLASHLHAHGYKNLTICDEREQLEDLPEHVAVQLGHTAFQNLLHFDLVFRSPGIALTRPEFRTFLESGREFWSVTKWFFESCPCPIIGVTGTKGKGTTSTLLTEILKRSEVLKKQNRRVFLGGNVGQSPLIFLDELKANDLVVLELSSFQLEDLHKSPQISIVLNLTSDHLDIHPDTESYRRAKENIVAHQDEADLTILNGDYESSRKFAALTPAKKHYYSIKPENPTGLQSSAYLDGENLVVLGEPVATRSDVQLRGAHNLENVLPALLAAKLFYVENEACIDALRAFKGLPHRLEIVAEIRGIKFVDDSISTTPETSIAAIRAFHEPVHLIAGGSEKHADFHDWALACAEAPNLKTVVLIGQCAARMENALQDALEDFARENPAHPRSLLDVVRAENLPAALEFLRAQTQTGDIVLLSPACASFDQFKDYKDRGDQFKDLAKS